MTEPEFQITEEEFREFQAIVQQVETADTDDFSELAKLLGRNPKRDFIGSDLGGADLSGANLSGANLSGADLSGANLSGADLGGANLSRVNLDGTKLIGANLSNANLRDANLSCADLSGADLSGANLSGADLSGASLSGADLGGANLSRVNLDGTKLIGANLSNANLRDANLSCADLGEADLSGADLNGADLNGAKLEGSWLEASQRKGKLKAALITLNVFQNSLAKQDPRWKYYVALLRRLSCQPVRWYMTDLDYRLAWIFWTKFELEDELCQEAYLGMLKQVTPCPINQHIWDKSGCHAINFSDALRLACAIDRNMDEIVTWEPEQFAQITEEHQHAQSHRYFYKPIVSEGLEPDETLTLRLGVFSVATYLLNFSGTGRRRSLRSRWPQYFRLEALQFGCSGNEHQASITLCDPTGEYLTVNASGDSPFDVIQRAIDQVVDRYFEIPARQLSRFYVPQTPILGANATVEVVICIECGDQSIQKSASHSSMLRAAAEAYVKVINDLCHHPDISSRKLQTA